MGGSGAGGCHGHIAHIPAGALAKHGIIIVGTYGGGFRCDVNNSDKNTCGGFTISSKSTTCGKTLESVKLESIPPTEKCECVIL